MLFSIPTQIGYGALFGLVLAESAGVPVPGETALLTAGVLAGKGQLVLEVVVGVAATAAIIGDGIGFWLGRRGGRALLMRDGRFATHRRHAVERGDRFFARYGAGTVFFGRFVPGVRIVAAVLAGASAMPWRRFALFNAAGALAWATSVATLASLVGPVGAAVFGGLALGTAGVTGLAAVIRERLRRRVVAVEPESA